MDLAAIQAALCEREIDAWLFCDHHRRDPIAYSVLGLPPDLHVTRRWYYLIPAQGEPLKLNHRVEPRHLNSLPGQQRHYGAWQEMWEQLREMLRPYKRVAMQYSPKNQIMYVSLVDGGTLELVRGFGIEVVSSADLVARFEATVSPEQIATHFEARDAMDGIMEACFQWVGQQIRNGGTHEFAVQQWLGEAFRREHLITDDLPIVGVNENSGNPHYMPTADSLLNPEGSYGYLRAYHYGLDGTGKPALTLAGSSPQQFGFSSSAPIVTSNGTTSGSALLWIVWNPDETGNGAELRAYDVLPVNGVLPLRWSAPVGQGPKFCPPGVAANRLYVGTRDGYVLGFGVLPSGSVGGAGTPRSTRLSDAHPNPCTRGTTFELALARSGEASLAIYDAGGRRVRSLLGGEAPAGTRTVTWDARDDAGARVPAGLYFARLEVGGERCARRVLVLR